jgi:hypothetical protein
MGNRSGLGGRHSDDLQAPVTRRRPMAPEYIHLDGLLLRYRIRVSSSFESFVLPSFS